MVCCTKTVGGSTFNRTNLELKPIPPFVSKASTITFNRTNLELKLQLYLRIIIDIEPFNRTNLELKLRFPVLIGLCVDLLIAPIWN